MKNKDFPQSPGVLYRVVREDGPDVLFEVRRWGRVVGYGTGRVKSDRIEGAKLFATLAEASAGPQISTGVLGAELLSGPEETG